MSTEPRTITRDEIHDLRSALSSVSLSVEALALDVNSPFIDMLRRNAAVMEAVLDKVTERLLEKKAA